MRCTDRRCPLSCPMIFEGDAQFFGSTRCIWIGLGVHKGTKTGRAYPHPRQSCQKSTLAQGRAADIANANDQDSVNPHSLKLLYVTRDTQ